jgi:hypothetical protein
VVAEVEVADLAASAAAAAAAAVPAAAGKRLNNTAFPIKNGAG